MFVTERKAAMGKLAEIKDMEEAVEQENNEAKEFIRFTKRQEEHNQLMEKLMKITAGCAAGVLAVEMCIRDSFPPDLCTELWCSIQHTAKSKNSACIGYLDFAGFDFDFAFDAEDPFPMAGIQLEPDFGGWSWQPD